MINKQQKYYFLLLIKSNTFVEKLNTEGYK